MKSRLSIGILAVAVLMTLAGTAHAQILSPISVTGFNLDPIYSDPSANQTDANGNFQSFNFVTANYSGAGSFGLPDNGTIVSSGNPNATFQLQPYTQNNVLALLNANGSPSNLPTTGTLTLSTPGMYSNLSFILTNAGSGGVNVTFNFAGGSSTTENIAVLPYWVGGDPTPSGGVVASNALQIYNNTNANLDEYDFALSPVDSAKTLDSVTFSFTNPSGSLGIFALSGTEAVPEPSTWAMLFGGLGLLAFVGRLRARQNA
jgi:hypothetical protein